MKILATLLLLCSACACSNAQQPNLLTNFQYMAVRENLEDVIAAPVEEGLHDLRIEEGSEVLLQRCLDDPGNWEKDPLIFRLAHKHAMTAIGCREKTNPSLHAVFYKMPDGSRQAWVHFDFYGPNNRPGHTMELVRNRLTFSHTEQTGVQRSLLRRYADPKFDLHDADYDLDGQFHSYLKDTFGTSALLSSLGTGSVGAFMSAVSVGSSNGWGAGVNRYANHIEGNLARHTIQETIEFGASALLRQDEKFATTRGDASVRARIKSALYHSFFVERPGGDELAFPRVAAAFGTAWAAERWHPWRRGTPDPWMDASIILSRYVARSFWHEFKPDVKNMRRRLRLTFNSALD